MSNITITLKTKEGKNPSKKNPVYVRVGKTTRKIDKPLSVTRSAGRNALTPPFYRRIMCFLGIHRYEELDFYVYIGENEFGESRIDTVPGPKRCFYCGKVESINSL